jgi:pyrimidine deaminase RibD-like protein
VLVSEGRVIGEGYHRYDRLKHAESFAIEMAGELARGATLYCSLEPCCHYGRTPPCTDSLIEAGIIRAVIAIKDPDRRVSGKGIEQLRGAGIAVEVGLCEDEARQVTEAYLKHATTGSPFIHGVIDLTIDMNWQPSPQLIRMVSAYDAIAPGQNIQASLTIAESFLKRPRHRLPIIICEPDLATDIRSMSRSINNTTGFILIEIDERPVRRQASGNYSNFDLSIDTGSIFSVEPGIASTVAALARLRATSLLIMPGSKACDEKSIIENSDRLTVFSRNDEKGESLHSSLSALDERIRLDVTDTAANNEALETTGYAKRSERALD